MKETDPRFYEIVNQKLREDALEMIEDYHQAHRAAENCGCHQCQMWAERMDQQCEDEAFRITYQPDIDHEEQILINYALSKLKNED